MIVDITCHECFRSECERMAKRKIPKRREASDDLQPYIDELVADGWTYATAKDDDTGSNAMVLVKGDERITLSMGVTTEGGMLCAFIGFDDDGPAMVRERRDKRGIWRVVDPGEDE
jgi:hypothetical protein